MRVVNFLAGPGAGKSTAATGLFSELKRRGVNCEYIPEFAKDAAWEDRGKKFFAAQQYIYGEQSWRQDRVKDDVDIMITDSPLIMAFVYMPDKFPIPSLKKAMMEDFNRYDNLNIFLRRSTKFNPSGRKQVEKESVKLDGDILEMLGEKNVEYSMIDIGITTSYQVIELMIEKGWDKKVPSLLNNPSEEEIQKLVNFYY